jgi:hypothetical protein
MQYGTMLTRLHEDCKELKDDATDEEWTNYFSNKYPLIEDNECGGFDYYENLTASLVKINHPQKSEYNWIALSVNLMHKGKDVEGKNWTKKFYEAISTNPHAIIPLPDSKQNAWDYLKNKYGYS